MKSIMMRIAADHARNAKIAAAHRDFRREWAPLCEEQEDAIKAAYYYEQEDLREIQATLDRVDVEDPDFQAAMAEADARTAEVRAACARRVQEAYERCVRAVALLRAARNAAIAAAEAAHADAWAAAAEQGKVDGWKATLRRGDWTAKVRLAGALPDGHPFLRRLARDRDEDVRLAAMTRLA